MMRRISTYISLLFCIALFAACREEWDNETDDNRTVAEAAAVVRLTLEGVHADEGRNVNLDFGMRSIATPVADGQAATLQNLLLLFADFNGNIVHAEKIDRMSSEMPDNVKDFQVPGSVRTVYALGNYANKSTELTQFANAVLQGTPRPVSDFLALGIPLSALQDVENVALFGADTDGLTTLPGSTEDRKLLAASLTLRPIVSRLEIAGISCTNLSESWFRSLLLRYIGLAKYYTTVTVEGKVPEGATFVNLSDICPPADDPAGESGGSYLYQWGDADTPEAYRWAWDEVKKNGQAVTLTAESPKADFSATPFAYNFIPKANPVAGNDLTLKLYLNPEWKTGLPDDPLITTVTANFSGQSGFTDTPGQIYRVQFDFKGENITSWDPKSLLRVKITVTVKPWTVKYEHYPVLS